MIEANGVKLCADAIGHPGNPPVLLVMGMSASMVWWEDELCTRLADGRRFVIRYDHRDTGRSVTYQVEHPGYTASDLVADAAGLLDAYELDAAHIVGVSMGGALAQLLALDFPDRVLSLTLISTSPATPGERDLPPGQDRLRRFLATVQVDWSDPTSVVDHLDPMFPLEHGTALANEIPGAKLLPLQAAGHGLDPGDWETVNDAILDHTSLCVAGR